MSCAMAREEDDTEQLLRQAARGDQAARGELLERHRPRLRRMVELRLDRRLAARIDSSDVVQEAMAEAVQKLSGYLEERAVPFYPWLRQLAWERLVQLHRRHLQTRKRSVMREEQWTRTLPDESVMHLAERLLAPGSSPSARACREELRGRVRAALARLRDQDREVLVLRHLEQLTPREIAVVLQVSEAAVYMRHLRALERLRALLSVPQGEDAP
jgi:RNA polymerase sigma-70 factor (ECF subfamily)